MLENDWEESVDVTTTSFPHSTNLNDIFQRSSKRKAERGDKKLVRRSGATKIIKKSWANKLQSIKKILKEQRELSTRL